MPPNPKLISSPAALGYRMPAEWETHRATWITWPHNRQDWESKLATVHWAYVEIVRHLVAGERVRILVQDGHVERRARRKLEQAMVDLSRVDFFAVPTNRSWIRDYGPIYVAKREDVAITDWRFNAWAKYSNWQLDDQVPERLASLLELERFEVAVDRDGGSRRVVLEGGSIDVNGRGLLLTTEECLLSPVQSRNRGFSREEIEEILKEYLGAEKTLWLKGGIAGDDTHGHIDDVARFVAPDIVVAAVEENRGDDNHAGLEENLQRLEVATDLEGNAIQVVPLPLPVPLYFEGVRLPASYLNFYIGNQTVLVPTFNDPADRIALGRLSDLFRDRQVVGIHAVDLVLGQGTVHCLTHQEPHRT